MFESTTARSSAAGRVSQYIRIGRVVMAEGRFGKSLPPFLIAAKNHVLA
jgi:hypothetical protein